ncbi:MAG TPA: hypothetical protein VFH06_05265 [Candidatus Saccharimonadales bacterium]|nr:hypothetical protein [Candidatus Saccharimonadales bacterium]
MKDQPFTPTVYGEPEGHRYVYLRPNHGIDVELLVNRLLCYMHGGICAAIVRWMEGGNGELEVRIYAPSDKHAALVPSGMSLIKLAELREEGVLIDLRDIVEASQTYWVADMRTGKETGRSYFFPGDDCPSSTCLLPESVYARQREEVSAPALAYSELMGLVRTPPEDSLVLREPPVAMMSSHQLYDQGVRLIIEDMTAIQRISDAKEESA